MVFGVKYCPQHRAGEDRIGSSTGKGPQGEGTAAEIMENTIGSGGLEGTEGVAGSTTDESPREWGHKVNGVRAPGDTGQEERKEADVPRTVGALSPTRAKPSRLGHCQPGPPPEPGFQPVVCQPRERTVSKSLSLGGTGMAKGFAFAVVESQLPQGHT